MIHNRVRVFRFGVMARLKLNADEEDSRKLAGAKRKISDYTN